MIHCSGSAFLWILPSLRSPCCGHSDSSLHRAWSGLTWSLWQCPLPVMMWAQPSRQVMLWAHIPGGMGPILNGSTALEICFSREELLGFAFQASSLCKGLLSEQGEGNVLGQNRSCSSTASVLGVCATPTLTLSSGHQCRLLGCSGL